MADFPDSTPIFEIPRQIVEAEIEMLIDLLDRLDPDPALEDGADDEPTGDEEPNLGAPNHQAGSWNGIDASSGGNDDEELELGWTEMEARSGRYGAAGADVYEPSLGSTGSIHQGQWCEGGADDTEDEHDGRQPDVEDEPELGWTDLQARTGRYVLGPGWYVSDGEPTLGSTSSLNQLHWSNGKNDDLEEQCDDEGASDADLEPDLDGEGTGNYVGDCSPTETMFQQKEDANGN
jgi:hypothetical protein